jgi:hypothetical protein
MSASKRYEPCPPCDERGTKAANDRRYRPGITPKDRRCPLCPGDGSLLPARLRAVIRRGLSLKAHS